MSGEYNRPYPSRRELHREGSAICKKMIKEETERRGQSISQAEPTFCGLALRELVRLAPRETPKSSSSHPGSSSESSSPSPSPSTSSASLKSHEQGIFCPDSPYPKEAPRYAPLAIFAAMFSMRATSCTGGPKSKEQVFWRMAVVR